MATVSDKLATVYDTKSKIRDAINMKGGTLLENTPFTEYPNAIMDLQVAQPGSGSYKWMKNPTWWDINKILEADQTDGYVAVYARLDINATPTTTISLSTFHAARTSDGKFHTENTTHVWDTTKDKESDGYYKTRYIIYYVKTDSDWLHGDYVLRFTPDVNSYVHDLQVHQKYTIGLSFNRKCMINTNSGGVISTPKTDWKHIGSIYIMEVLSDGLLFVDVTKKGKLYVKSWTGRYSLYLFRNCKYICPLYSFLDIPVKTIFSDQIGIGWGYTEDHHALHGNDDTTPDIEQLFATIPLNTSIDKTATFYTSNLNFTLVANANILTLKTIDVSANRYISSIWHLVPVFYDVRTMTISPSKYLYPTKVNFDETEGDVFFDSFVYLAAFVRLNTSELRKFILRLRDRTGLTAGNLTLNNIQNDLLSTSDKLLASQKNWSIAIVAI